MWHRKESNLQSARYCFLYRLSAMDGFCGATVILLLYAISATVPFLSFPLPFPLVSPGVFGV